MEKIYYDDATLRSLKDRGIHWYALAVSAIEYQTWFNRDFMTPQKEVILSGCQGSLGCYI